MISWKPLGRRSIRNIFTIREEKHKEYLHNAGCKSLSLDFNKSNKNSKQCSSLQDRNIDKNEPKETNNQFPWASATCAIARDSMVNGIDEEWLWQGHGNFKVFHFSGARISDINQYIIPIIKKQPDYLILDVETDDASTSTSKKIADDILMLESNISKQLPSCGTVLSSSIIRHDDRKANLAIPKFNKHLSALQSECFENNSIVHYILEGNNYI